MKRPLTLADATIAALVVAVAILAARLIWVGSPARLQSYNMSQAAEHVLRVEQALAADPRFDELRVGVYTGQGGAIWVQGYVPDDAAAFAVRQAVEGTEPPVAVRYGFQVYSRLLDGADD